MKISQLQILCTLINDCQNCINCHKVKTPFFSKKNPNTTYLRHLQTKFSQVCLFIYSLTEYNHFINSYECGSTLANRTSLPNLLNYLISLSLINKLDRTILTTVFSKCLVHLYPYYQKTSLCIYLFSWY